MPPTHEPLTYIRHIHNFTKIKNITVQYWLQQEEFLLSFFFCTIHWIHSAGLTVDPPTKTLCQKLGGPPKSWGPDPPPSEPPVVAPLFRWKCYRLRQSMHLCDIPRTSLIGPIVLFSFPLYLDPQGALKYTCRVSCVYYISAVGQAETQGVRSRLQASL